MEDPADLQLSWIIHGVPCLVTIDQELEMMNTDELDIVVDFVNDCRFGDF